VLEAAQVRPSSALAPHLGVSYGYRITGYEPGVHAGLPSGFITVVISLAEPTALAALPDRNDGTASFQALVGGLHRRAVEIHHDGSQYGIQLAIRPASARALFGMPAAALTSVVVDLDGLIPAARHLPERLAGVASWSERFGVVSHALEVALSAEPRPSRVKPDVQYAWERIVTSGGAVRVNELATETGWSRRHLTGQFTSEFGIGPKEAARIVRFQRSRQLLERNRPTTCADVAAICGYADQAHMTREWATIAGCTPTTWREREDLPFVQDESEVAVPG
jgi:AraC-like DNA-binding protein